jgi:hypothetical protein
MTHEELRQMLYNETLVGNAPAAKAGFEDGLEPARILMRILMEPRRERVPA